jgi:hypothetical protein
MILTVIADLALTFPAPLMALSGESGNLKMKVPKHSLVGCVPVAADKACLMNRRQTKGRRVGCGRLAGALAAMSQTAPLSIVRLLFQKATPPGSKFIVPAAPVSSWAAIPSYRHPSKGDASRM